MPRAPHLPVTRDARLGRRLLAEQQVLAPPFGRVTQLPRHPRVAPERPSSAAGGAGETTCRATPGLPRRSAAAPGYSSWPLFSGMLEVAKHPALVPLTGRPR